MMKRKYNTPKMETLEFCANVNLLQASLEPDTDRVLDFDEGNVIELGFKDITGNSRHV